MQSSGGMNIVWADITETKCRAASAWIREIVLPVGEQPWGIGQTPLPDLPPDIKRSVVNKALQKAQEVMQQTAQAGGGTLGQEEFRELTYQLGEKLRTEAEKTVTKMASLRAKRMEKQIADRLAQGGYEEAMDAFVEDFVTYPGALVKGPFYIRRKSLAWGSSFTPGVNNLPTQVWAHVSPFDAYPSGASQTPQQGDFIERQRFQRDELYDLKGMPDYKDDQIDEALTDYSEGHLEGWLWGEGERQRLEQETMYMWLSPPGVIDALNFWGSVPGWKLKSWGVTGDKETGELKDTCDYECNVLLCGRYVLYAALNPDPLNRRPYRKACYDEIPGAFWGRSIPDLASTHQKMCNSIACALADNLSHAAGPQVWVHVDRFADGENSVEMFPWKVWQMKSDSSQGANPGIGFFQADDRSGPLMATYEQWERRADDATGIPRYTYGNETSGGSASTATGLSMLLNNAAKGLRRAISNIDINVIAPSVEQTFVNEMLYNPDQSIKGDCVVVPRGAAAILIKESAQQRRTQFLGMVGNPIDMAIIGNKGRAALLRETASAMELPVDDIVPTVDEIEEKEQQAQQAQAEQMKAQAGQMLEMKVSETQIETKAQLEILQAKAAIDAQSQSSATMAEIVKKAVESALVDQQKTKPRKKIRFNYDANGDMVGGEEITEA